MTDEKCLSYIFIKLLVNTNQNADDEERNFEYLIENIYISDRIYHHQQEFLLDNKDINDLSTLILSKIQSIHLKNNQDTEFLRIIFYILLQRIHVCLTSKDLPDLKVNINFNELIIIQILGSKSFNFIFFEDFKHFS